MKVDHNRRCYIADLDFGEGPEGREALERFHERWLRLIEPWLRRDHEGNPYFTVDFRTFAEIVASLRPAVEVSEEFDWEAECRVLRRELEQVIEQRDTCWDSL